MGGKKYEFIGVVETTRACMRKNNGWLMEVKNDARLFFSPFFSFSWKKNQGRQKYWSNTMQRLDSTGFY